MCNHIEQPEDILYCPYCGKPTKLVDSKVIYKKSGYGLIYLCKLCNAYVGVHKGTTIPKGTPANRILRELRKQLHLTFDPKWKYGKMERNEAYAWLADKMGIDVKHCHISSFNTEQCNDAIDICNAEDV